MTRVPPRTIRGRNASFSAETTGGAGPGRDGRSFHQNFIRSKRDYYAILRPDDSAEAMSRRTGQPKEWMLRACYSLQRTSVITLHPRNDFAPALENSRRRGPRVGVLGGLLLATALVGRASAGAFTPGDLLVTRSVYSGDASTVTVGQTLPDVRPRGGHRRRDLPLRVQQQHSRRQLRRDVPIFLDQITPSGTLVSTLAVPNMLTTRLSARNPSWR